MSHCFQFNSTTGNCQLQQKRTSGIISSVETHQHDFTQPFWGSLSLSNNNVGGRKRRGYIVFMSSLPFLQQFYSSTFIQDFPFSYLENTATVAPDRETEFNYFECYKGQDQREKKSHTRLPKPVTVASRHEWAQKHKNTVPSEFLLPSQQPYSRGCYVSVNTGKRL